MIGAWARGDDVVFLIQTLEHQARDFGSHVKKGPDVAQFDGRVHTHMSMKGGAFGIYPAKAGSVDYEKAEDAMHVLMRPRGAMQSCDQGPRHAPVVLFANSLGTDPRLWEAVVRRLPAGRRVIRYDKRRQGLADGAGPALMAGDAESASPPDLVKTTADLIPGARYHAVEGAGHLPSVEAPEVFSERLIPVLKEVCHV